MCQKVPPPNSILSLLCLCLLTAWGEGGSSGIAGDGTETGNYSACQQNAVQVSMVCPMAATC